jgi:hypothetical protein
VHCNELRPNKFVTGGGERRVLYQGEFSTDGVSFSIEPRWLQLAEVGVSEITSLSFKLTDENGRTLSLSDGGQSTILEIELKSSQGLPRWSI